MFKGQRVSATCCCLLQPGGKRMDEKGGKKLEPKFAPAADAIVHGPGGHAVGRVPPAAGTAVVHPGWLSACAASDCLSLLFSPNAGLDCV